MAKKINQGKFNLDELKEQIGKIKEAAEEAKTEAENKKNLDEELPKEPLWKKILGIIIVIGLLGAAGYALISDADTVVMPKNTITIIVKDENEKAVDGLRLKLIGPSHYNVDYTDIADYTILDATPGDYLITFEIVPEGYTCEKVTDNFTLNEGGKVKLEYSCSKK